MASIAPRTLNRGAPPIYGGAWLTGLARWVPKVNAPWKRKRRLNASAVNRKRPALNWVGSLFIVRQFRSIVKRACSWIVDQIIINTGNIRFGLNIVGRKRRQQNRFFSIWSSWTFLDLLKHLVKQMYEHFLTESLILAQDERWRRA